MSKLIESLIAQIIEYSNEDKRKLGTRIVELIGGDATTNVSNLPARRGLANGGMDGRIKIIATKINKVVRPTEVVYEKLEEEEQDAGISVKIEGKKFSREQLGGFKLDLERESLYVGIIITGRGLSPDAKSEVERLNKEGIYRFFHIPLEDFLSGKINFEGIKFAGGDISEKLREGVAKFIAS